MKKVTTWARQYFAGMKKKNQLTVVFFAWTFGYSLIWGPIVWNVTSGWPVEAKIGSVVFLYVVIIWHFFAHRTPDKTGFDEKYWKLW